MTHIQIMKAQATPGNPEAQIAEIVRIFQETPYDFFSEPELHARFYSLCRDKFPTFKTSDGKSVAAFRCQYETVWRYQRGDRFSDRYHDRGTVSTFDFVVLRRGFILYSTYLTVLNKTEPLRTEFRTPPGKDQFYTSLPTQQAIELKLAHVQDKLEISEGQINRLEDRLLAACCKLAQERVPHAYIIGLSQGPQPDWPRANSMVDACLRLYKARYPDGEISVCVATPEQTLLGGDWLEEVEFPKVTIAKGWPVGNDEESTLP